MSIGYVGLAEPDEALLSEAADKVVFASFSRPADEDPTVKDDMLSAVKLTYRVLVTLRGIHQRDLSQLGLGSVLKSKEAAQSLRAHSRVLAVEEAVLAIADAGRAARDESAALDAELRRIQKLRAEEEQANRKPPPTTVLDTLRSSLDLGDALAEAFDSGHKLSRARWEVLMQVRPIAVGLIIGAFAYTALTEALQSVLPGLNSLIVALLFAGFGWLAVLMLDKWTYSAVAKRWLAVMEASAVMSCEAYLRQRGYVSLLRRGIPRGDVDPGEVGRYTGPLEELLDSDHRLVSKVSSVWANYQLRLLDSVSEARGPFVGSSIRPVIAAD